MKRNLPALWLLAVFCVPAHLSFAAAPSLSIQQLPANQLRLTWPGTAAGFSLEQANSLTSPVAWQAVSASVANGGGVFSVTIQPATQTRFYRLRGGLPTTILETSPAHGESGVAVTRETIFRLSAPLAADATVTTAQLFAEYGGRRLLSRVEIAGDHRTVTLFYLENLPASARLRVSFVGDGLKDTSGTDLDADGDGQAGGTLVMNFDTLGITGLPGTGVEGRVFASEKTPTGANLPLVNVIITVDGAEQTLRTLTDTNGFFRLTPAPAGRFFVHVDGRTAVGSQWPGGAFYPFVGKAWDAVAGRTNNLAGGSGEIFLPLIPGDALQPVSMTSDTQIKFSSSVIATNPAFAQVSITVPANALFSDNGTRGGKVGLAPVPPDRLPGPLPPGLEMPLVITVQTDGGLNFDRPAPICFPNVTDPVLGTPLPAGSQQSLISFNHDKGEWEAVGTMTVSADGKLICSDPGSGIRQPGWHGVGPGGSGPPPGGGGCGGAGGGGGGPAPSLSLQNIRLHDDESCGCKQDPEVLQECYKVVNEAYDKCIALAAAAKNQCVKNCNKTIVCTDDQGDPALFCGKMKDCYGACFDAAKKRTDKCAQNLRAGTAACDICFGAGSGFASALARAGNAGKHVQAVLRQALAAADIDAAVEARFSEIERLVREPLPPNPAAVGLQIQQLFAEIDAITGGDATAYYLARAAEAERAAEALAVIVVENGNAPDYPVLYAAEIDRPSGPLFIRGQTLPRGQYSIFVPRDGRLMGVSFFDPLTRRYAGINPNVLPSATSALPHFTLAPLKGDELDTDSDGLPDLVELVYGTDPKKPDSDGDGLRDGVEIAQGSNPLDGIPMQQGILATVQTLGVAVDVCAFDNFAVVAEGAAGVSIFDAGNFFNPIRVAQVDTPGNAQAVACAGNLVAVADGTAGLAVIDISNRAASFIARQVPLSGNARAVSVAGGLAYVGLESGIVIVVELATGRILSTLNLGAGGLQDVLAVGDAVYALVSGRLNTLSFEGSALAITSEAGAGIFQSRRLRLNAGRGLLYSATISGFQIFGLSDPFKPVQLYNHVTPQRGWRQLVPNGSGLGVGVVGVTSLSDATDDVYLHDLKPGETNSVFLTRLPTPGIANALAIFNGLAYVADGGAGLQVMNYLAADTLGVPPTIALGTSFPLTPLAQAESGSRARLTAEVGDDVQVRNVEFYLDGALLATDGNYPFEASFTTALLSTTKTNFTFRAKATDTGGNSTWTPERTVALVADLTPPRVRRITPADGAKIVDRLTVYFNEPIRPASFNPATVRIRSAGADGIFDTADDTTVSAASYPVNEEAFAAEVRFAAPLPDGRYRVTVTPGVTDLSNNPLPAAVTQDLRVLDATFWTGRADTAWENPLNWNPLVVPGADDRVFLGSGSVRITTPVVVRSLESVADLEVVRASLEAPEGILLRRAALLNIGTLRKSSLAMADGAILRVSNQNWSELDDMTITGIIDMGNEGQLILRNRLTLQGTLRGNNRAFLRIEGTTTFAGGTLEFAGGTINLADGAVFTLAPDAILSGDCVVNGPGAFLNQGALRTGVSGLTVAPGLFTHLGSAEVSGGSLVFLGKWSGDGTVNVTQGAFTMSGEFGLPLPRVTKAAAGNVNVAGAVNLQGGAITLNAATGSWRLNGGGLRNGTLHLLEGAEIFISQSAQNFLENMTVNGGIRADNGGALTVRGGLALNGTLRQSFGANTRFEGEQTITGGTVDVIQSGLTLPDGAKLTLSESTVLRGLQGTVSGAGMLINRGKILADSALNVTPSAVEHHGTIEVTNGSTLTLGGQLTGPGPIDVTQGLLILTAQFGSVLPDVRKAPAGTVFLRSMIDLEGGTAVFNATTGGWNIQGGGFRNGTITLQDGVVMNVESVPENLLENVSVNGTLNLAQSFNWGLLKVRGGLTLNGAMLLAGNAAVTFEGEQTFTGSAIQFGDGGRVIVPADAQLTLAPTALVHGRNGTLEGAGALLNQGKISADVAGGTLRVTVTTFTNNGTLEAINGGTLVAPGFP